MRYSAILLINSIIMTVMGYLEFQDNREARILPLLFVFLGIIVLSMKNTVAAGSKSVGNVSLVFILLSFFATIEPIFYAYERYHIHSVYRYSSIATANFITIILLINFLFFDKNKPRGKYQ